MFIVFLGQRIHLWQIVFSCRMKLNHKTHKIVIDELDRVRVHAGGRKEDVSEETRNVIEKLTGISYDKCFGNNNIWL